MPGRTGTPVPSGGATPVRRDEPARSGAAVRHGAAVPAPGRTRLRGGAPAAGRPAPQVRPIATAVLLCLGMVVIPLVALGSGGGAAARGAVRAAAAAGPADAALVPAPHPQVPVVELTAASAAHVAPAQFSTPLAVAAAAPAARQVPVLARRVTAVVAAPRATAVTAVTAPPATAPAPRPAVVAAPVASHVEQGLASWYNAPHGTCAHPTLPFGTILTVTNVATGASVTCRVDDRGPYAGGRVVDLSPDVFARLAPLAVGVATVRVTW